MTGATWLESAGVPLTAVRRLLGHSSVTVTEISAHPGPAAVSEAACKLDGGHSLVTPESRWDEEDRTPDLRIANAESMG